MDVIWTPPNMKKILILIILFVSIFTKPTFSEQTTMGGNLVTSWGQDGNTLYINAHNKHTSKSIIIERINIWFRSCSNTDTSSTPDRVYRMYGVVYPMSDKRITEYVNISQSGEMCATIEKKWKTTSTSTYKPPKVKQKSGTQKFLDKILGN